MSVDSSKPTDNDVISEHAARIRAIAALANSNEAAIGLISTSVAYTNLTLTAGQTSISIGSGAGNLSTAFIELVNIQATGAVTLEDITGGRSGQIKIFIAVDADVSIENDATAITGGKFRLNQIPAINTIDLEIGDVIAFVNIGGDGSTLDGYWKELFRTLYVG